MFSVAASWILLGLWMFLCVGFVNSYYMDNGNSEDKGSKHAVSYSYDRIGEVNKACAFVLKSAAELKPDDSRLYTIKEDLSFLNGNWWQDLNGGGAPLMPFDDRELSGSSTDLRSPMKLVSFWVTDVDRRHHSKKSIFVSGILQMGITLEGLLSEKPFEGSPRFDIWPGHSQLSVNFQGIYTEPEKDHGERVMCLLGSAVLPSRQPDSADPWGWVKEFGYTNQPLLTQDDQIVLVLRYPKTVTLRSRAVHGSLKSLNPKSNLKYFDEVQVSSWLSSSANYQFDSENLVSKACDPYPYKDSFVNGDIDIYKGLDFCDILERFTHQEALAILPNWKCNGTDDFCSRLGPFVSDKEIKATDGSFKNVKLVLQDVRCENMTSKENGWFTRVSSVFRAVPPSENRFTAAQRTGLSNMTLSAEGIWKSSSGQLCMVGCSAFVDTDGHGCNTRICLYVPLSFSIKQRSILLGTMSSIDSSPSPYFPLAFEKLVRPAELWAQFTASHPYYKYSKIVAASVVLEKDEPFNFGTVIKKSLLKFPKLEDMGNFHYSLSLLAEELTLHIGAVPDLFPSSNLAKADLEMEILSLGPLFGRYWPTQYASTIEKENTYPNKGEYTEKQLLLNVSGLINLVGKEYSNFSSLFVEGIYDPHVGKMYLIGCRDVRASWKTLYESMDLEAGLDCSIELMVSYPPTTARWLVNPTARISISSQRTEDDPLYFIPVKLQTVPIMYRRQREDIISRRGVEGILRILTLSIAIACILSQLFYIRDNMESVPYISLVMLGVQALGYSFPLITGAEALLKKASTEFSENQSYDLQNSQWLHVIDYTVKVLVLVAFSVTLRLCQKVWKSRIRMQTRAPLEPHRVPSDKKVLFTTLSLHIVGYIIALIVHYVNTSYKPLQTAHFVDSTGYSHVIREWETELEEYLGLVQDFFLLPQVIANLMWRIHVKPLGKLYYVGITSVRLLPHVYDYITSPIPNPYFSEEYEFVNPRMDFYSKFGDIAIPTIAVLLAVTVYIQQKWNYEKLSQTFTLSKAKFLPLGSKVYQRLPSVSCEAELSSGVNKNSTSEEGHDAE
ncbi:PII protein [Perilla frutescens var. frutescens]|nr:PII protein [Perilla frutescens var. frutescens]